MAINNTASVTGTALTSTPTGTNPKSKLGKDDFLKLLLVELRYQDPTEPMDTEKILAQTSELGALEASENTNKALEKLAKSLGDSRAFSTISAIGKIADTGSNAVVYKDGAKAKFELYFSENIKSGTVEVLNSDGTVVSTMPVAGGDKGVHTFEWDGKDSRGDKVDEGIYYITARYSDANGVEHNTRVGRYPIESVRFDEGKTLVKVGSSYIPFTDIKEVIQG